MFLTALDQTIVATALPTIGRQFEDVTNLSWVITAYLLSSTAVAPVYGTLSDIYGRRAMIILSLTLFLVGSVLCAIAPNLLTLILARALQGIGGGGILPLVQTVISDVVTPRERGQYQAYFSSVWVAAGIGGPVLGGLFAEHLHWSVIFWINLPLGVLSLVLLLPKMGKIPVFHRKRKVDWVGGLLLMASAVIIMLVLTWGGNKFALGVADHRGDDWIGDLPWRCVRCSRACGPMSPSRQFRCCQDRWCRLRWWPAAGCIGATDRSHRPYAAVLRGRLRPVGERSGRRAHSVGRCLGVGRLP